MMATNAEEKADDDFYGVTVCHLCSKPFTDSRMLPCVHTFCLSCLEDWMNSKENPEEKTKCPICHRAFEIPEGGCCDLNENNFVNRLLKTKKLSFMFEIQCNVCVKESGSLSVNETLKPAKFYCIECQQRLCEACTNQHKERKPLASHDLMPFGNVGSRKKLLTGNAFSSLCTTHSNEIVKMYCTSCEEVVCMKCFDESHQSHSLVNISKAVEAKKQSLVEIGHSIEFAKKRDERLKAKLKRHKSETAKQLQLSRAAVRETTEKLKEVINKHENLLLVELDLAEDKLNKAMDAAEKEVSEAVKILDTFGSYSTALQANGSPSDMGQSVKLKSSVQVFLKDGKTRFERPQTPVAATFIAADTDLFERKITNFIGRITCNDQDSSIKNSPVVSHASDQPPTFSTGLSPFGGFLGAKKNDTIATIATSLTGSSLKSSPVVSHASDQPATFSTGLSPFDGPLGEKKNDTIATIAASFTGKGGSAGMGEISCSGSVTSTCSAPSLTPFSVKSFIGSSDQLKSASAGLFSGLADTEKTTVPDITTSAIGKVSKGDGQIINVIENISRPTVTRKRIPTKLVSLKMVKTIDPVGSVRGVAFLKSHIYILTSGCISIYTGFPFSQDHVRTIVLPPEIEINEDAGNIAASEEKQCLYLPARNGVWKFTAGRDDIVLWLSVENQITSISAARDGTVLIGTSGYDCRSQKEEDQVACDQSGFENKGGAVLCVYTPNARVAKQFVFPHGRGSLRQAIAVSSGNIIVVFSDGQEVCEMNQQGAIVRTYKHSYYSCDHHTAGRFSRLPAFDFEASPHCVTPKLSTANPQRSSSACIAESAGGCLWIGHVSQDNCNDCCANLVALDSDLQLRQEVLPNLHYNCRNFEHVVFDRARSLLLTSCDRYREGNAAAVAKEVKLFDVRNA